MISFFHGKPGRSRKTAMRYEGMLADGRSKGEGQNEREGSRRACEEEKPYPQVCQCRLRQANEGWWVDEGETIGSMECDANRMKAEQTCVSHSNLYGAKAGKCGEAWTSTRLRTGNPTFFIQRHHLCSIRSIDKPHHVSNLWPHGQMHL